MLSLYAKLCLKLVVFWFIIVPLQGQTLKITSSSNKVFVRRGDNLSLNITYEYTGKNIVGVIWKNGSTAIIQKSITGTITSGNSRASLNGVNLVLKNVDRYDEATYQVQLLVDGILDTPRRSIKVIVTVAPKIELNCSDTIKPKEGENVPCECKCKDGNPPANATWFKNGVKIGETRDLKKTLLIENVKFKRDIGTYQCTCQSGPIKVTKKLTIIVQHAPNVVLVSSVKCGDTVFVTDETLNIICKADGYPEPTYKIFHNGTVVTNKGVYNKEKVVHSDAGNYTCEASNNFGKKNGSLILKLSGNKFFVTTTTSSKITKTTGDQGKIGSDKSNCSTQSYIIVVTFLGGTLFGFILSYGISLARRQLLNKEVKKSSNDQDTNHYENASAENNSTYQELDLSQMNKVENYQSLKRNTRSLGHNEVPKENEVGYAELNEVKGNKDENYQSLNRV